MFKDDIRSCNNFSLNPSVSPFKTSTGLNPGDRTYLVDYEGHGRLLDVGERDICEASKVQERFFTCQCVSDRFMEPEREEVVRVKDRIRKSEY